MVIETRPMTDAAREDSTATELSRLLADSNATYNKTLHYHWNVRGPHFYSLHKMFEEQYHELAEAIDVLAERIRCLGFYTPGTLAELTWLSRIRQPNDLRGSKAMLEHLILANTQVVHRCNELRGVAEEALEKNSMPPGAWPRLNSEERLVLTRWIARGAEAPCDD